MEVACTVMISWTALKIVLTGYCYVKLAVCRVASLIWRSVSDVVSSKRDFTSIPNVCYEMIDTDIVRDINSR